MIAQFFKTGFFKIYEGSIFSISLLFSPGWLWGWGGVGLNLVIWRKGNKVGVRDWKEGACMSVIYRPIIWWLQDMALWNNVSCLCELIIPQNTYKVTSHVIRFLKNLQFKTNNWTKTVCAKWSRLYIGSLKATERELQWFSSIICETVWVVYLFCPCQYQPPLLCWWYF